MYILIKSCQLMKVIKKSLNLSNKSSVGEIFSNKFNTICLVWMLILIVDETMFCVLDRNSRQLS